MRWVLFRSGRAIHPEPSHVDAAASPIINNPHNHYRPKPSQAYDLPSLPESLEKNGLHWRNYGGYAFQYIQALKDHPSNRKAKHFADDARSGLLPAVSWLYEPENPSLSEHPMQNVTLGMQWTLEQVKAVGEGPLWNSTVIFSTFDDWGGWYDHVTPPVVEN